MNKSMFPAYQPESLPWPMAPGSQRYAIPEEWIRAVRASVLMEKKPHGNSYGNSFERMLYDLVFYGSADFIKPSAIIICDRYLELRVKEDWPTLLGISPVMDEILGQRFKNG